MMEIKFATEDDAGLIADLSRQTFYETFASDNTDFNMDKFLSMQFTREKLMLEVGQPWHTFFLAYLGGTAVGYVKMRDGEVPSQLVGQSCIEIARIYSVK